MLFCNSKLAVTKMSEFQKPVNRIDARLQLKDISNENTHYRRGWIYRFTGC